jgi:hypothetical protein
MLATVNKQNQIMAILCLAVLSLTMFHDFLPHSHHAGGEHAYLSLAEHVLAHHSCDHNSPDSFGEVSRLKHFKSCESCGGHEHLFLLVIGVNHELNFGEQNALPIRFSYPTIELVDEELCPQFGSIDENCGDDPPHDIGIIRGPPVA